MSSSSPFVANKEPLPASRLRLPSIARSSLGSHKTTTIKPRISEPFGPIKNSRGPDLSRGDKLTIVESISAYVAETPSRLPTSTSTPRLGGGVRVLQKDILSGNDSKSRTLLSTALKPVTPRATLKPPPTGQYKHMRSNWRPLGSAAVPNSDIPLPKSQSTLDLTNLRNALRQDENTPPRAAKITQNRLPLPTKIPNSSTASAQETTKSPCARSSSTLVSVDPSALNVISNKPPPVSSAEIITPPPTLTRDKPSQLTNAELCGCSNTGKLPFGSVQTAQPSAYWTGRFLSTHDRLASAELIPKTRGRDITSHSPVSTSAHPMVGTLSRNSASPRRPTGLTHSVTTTALTAMTSTRSERSDDGDDRCRRVFAHLDSLCTTSEARRSLRDWQQSYARKQGKPALLPAEGTMNGKDRGLVMRLFGGTGARKEARQTLAALQNGSSTKAEHRPRRKETVT